MNTEALLTDIQNELKRLNTSAIAEATLWTQHDIAQYLSLSVKYLQNHKVFARSDFPRAVIIPIKSDGEPAKRWKAQEVVAWAQRLRDPQTKKKGK